MAAQHLESEGQPQQRHVSAARRGLQAHAQIENQGRVAQGLPVVNQTTRETAHDGRARCEDEGHEEAHQLFRSQGSRQLQRAVEAKQIMDGTGDGACDVDVEEEVDPFRGIEEGRLDVGQERPAQPMVRIPQWQAAVRHRRLDVALVQAVHVDPIHGSEDARLDQAHQHGQGQRAQHQHPPLAPGESSVGRPEWQRLRWDAHGGGWG
jgi:hypothetical protein